MLQTMVPVFGSSGVLTRNVVEMSSHRGYGGVPLFGSTIHIHIRKSEDPGYILLGVWSKSFGVGWVGGHYEYYGSGSYC
jgi:hypothetical protein